MNKKEVGLKKEEKERKEVRKKEDNITAFLLSCGNNFKSFTSATSPSIYLHLNKQKKESFL